MRDIGEGIDLRSVLIVVPGRRFGRELITELVSIGEKTEAWVSPGRVSTPGELSTSLIQHQADAAPALVRAFAWAKTLRTLDTEEFEVLLRRRPTEDSLAEWVRFGAMLDSSVGELARELILPGEVPQRCAVLQQMGDARRWEIIERCRQKYETILGEKNLVDGNLSNLAALRSQTRSVALNIREIVLVGVAELDGASRAAITRSGLPASALIFGPESESPRIDDFGCVRGEITRERVPIESSALEIAEDTKDCAARAVGRIAAWTQEHQGLVARDVSVCAPEPDDARDLALAARGVEGLRFHDASGEEIGRASVVKLLAAACDHLRERTLESLSAFVKRPEAERWIVHRSKPGRDWIARVDAAAVLNPGIPDIDSPDELREFAENVTNLLGGLASEDLSDRDAGGTLDEIIAFLERTFAGEELTERETEALSVIADSIAQLREGAGFIGDLPAWRWIELLLECISQERLTATSSREEIEVLGWLEAAVDRARFIVITGFNEGGIPSGRIEDPLLPERVRAELGMPTGESRAERDAFLLEGLIRSRTEMPDSTGRVWFICAKRDGEGNPLKPSRLLFRCDDDEAIERIERLSSEIPEAPGFVAAKSTRDEYANGSGIGFPEAPLHDIALPNVVRATAFKEYIRSPYVFFLKHVARLTEVSEPDAESDSGAMGSLIHQVLRDFGAGEAKAEKREDAIAQWVLSQFDRALFETSGPAGSSIRDIQVEVARRRLRTFARVQAAHARDGWSIHETEWESPTPIEIKAPSGKLLLKARLDRLDRRENEWLVLDYKTGDAAKEPGKTHVKSHKWIDLQLPLYVYLLRSCGLAPDGARAGYFLLPKKSVEGRIEFADWDDDQLAEAEALATQIVEGVLQRKFEHGDDPFEEGAIARLCGVTLLEEDPEESEE